MELKTGMVQEERYEEVKKDGTHGGSMDCRRLGPTSHEQTILLPHIAVHLGV